MSDFEMNLNTEKLAEEIGGMLVARLKDYLEDETDTDFLKEIALEMAEAQFTAATAISERDRERATSDIGFLDARIQTFAAKQAIKFQNEYQETATEILGIVGSALGAFAVAALRGMAG